MGFGSAAIDHLKTWAGRPQGRPDDFEQTLTASHPGHFDTSFYLATYPDIRNGLAGGAPRAPEAHWMTYGRHEVSGGHRPMSPDFDEPAYFARRPDVRAAVAAGTFLNGYDHWLRHGRTELEREEAAELFETHAALRPAILTDEQVRFWHRNGFLILKGLFAPERCDAVNRGIDALWRDPPSAPPVAIDINLDKGAERVRFRQATAESRATPYKLYDLVMCDAAVQGLALDRTLVAVLRWILDADPVCVSSLDFERSSTQGFHQDTLYMPGKRPGGMCAAWIALEDVDPAAGPLAYYAGSHRIPLFHFSSGKPNQIDDEFDTYYAYMMAEVTARGIEPTTFLPVKGDALIWNERLFHAGTAIENRALTRRSLVTHYWRANELPSGGVKSAAHGLYWDREWC